MCYNCVSVSVSNWIAYRIWISLILLSICIMLPSYGIQIDALHCGGYRVALLASADGNNESVKECVTIYRNITVNLQQQLEDVFGYREASTGELLYMLFFNPKFS